MVASLGRRSLLVSSSIPSWCQRLKNVPKIKIKMGLLPTKIDEFNIPDIPKGFSVSIKRDDLTGSSLSGNKIRKLEFLFADAIQQDCSHVITCGSLQSNHCRVTAIAAKELGIKSHLFLRSQDSKIGYDGNILLNRLVGANIYLVGKNEKENPDLIQHMNELTQVVKEKWNEKAYVISLGGSSVTGTFGYITAFDELLQQDVAQNFDDLVVACGSGGTTAGLAIGNYICGSPLRVHGITVCDNSAYFNKKINEILDDLGITEVRSETIVDIIDGYKGLGYGLSTEEELKFLISVAETTGIILDPTYSGKAAKGLVHEMHLNPSRFKGKRILFLHTGGIFSLYDGRMTSVLKQVKSSNQVVCWADKNPSTP